jgi:hypothetical protein
VALKNRISQELQTAMKVQDKVRLETLRMLRAALMEKEIELKARDRGLSPEEEFSVLMGAAKKRRESIEMFTRGNRTDLVELEKAGLVIIEEFLPKMMSPDDVTGVVKRIAGELGALESKDFSRLMQTVMKELKGKADGRVVQETVRKFLGT